MPKLTILTCLAIIFILSSCSGPRTANEREKLRSELQKWESFDGQGVVEMSFMGLAMRKMFSVSKNRNELRLDIFDGGIMGTGASPMLSFYSGDYLAFKSPYLPMLELFNPSDLVPAKSLDLFSSADTLLTRFGDAIIRDKKLEVDSVLISFSPKYKLDRVHDPKSNSELVASYAPNGNLTEMTLKSTNNMSVRLIFDDIKYIQPEIIPLPQATVNNSLKQFMNEGDLKTMLKEYLKNK